MMRVVSAEISVSASILDFKAKTPASFSDGAESSGRYRQADDRGRLE